MPNNQTRQLAHGAMMIVLFALLFAITIYIPIVSLVTLAFTPLPIAWYSIHYNNSASMLVLVGCIVISFFIGGFLVIPVALLLALIGFAIGMSIRNEKSKLNMLITTSISTLAGISVMYVLLLTVFEINLIQNGLDLFRQSYETAINSSEKLIGASSITMEQVDEIIKVMEATTPAAIIISSVVIAFIFISINLPMLKRLKVDVPKFGKFSSMRLPKAVLWYYLIVLVVSIFVNPEMGTTLYLIVVNFMLILWVLLTIQGVSFLHFLIDEKKYPKFLKVIVVIIAFPLYNFILLVGVFDLGFEIRKYISGKNQN